MSSKSIRSLSGDTVIGSSSWTSGCSTSSTKADDTVASKLLAAIFDDDIENISSLLQPSLDFEPAHYWLLYLACLHGLEMITVFLSRSTIDLNQDIPGEDGDRLLHFVLRTPSTQFVDGRDEIVLCLLHHGADPLICDRIGDNALHALAGVHGSGYLMQFLFDLRSDCLGNIDARNNPQKWRRYLTSTTLTQEDMMSERGNSPLIIAVQNNNVDCVQILLKNGADLTLQGEGGQSAIYFAIARDSSEMALLLLKNGAEMGQDSAAVCSVSMERTLRDNGFLS